MKVSLRNIIAMYRDGFRSMTVGRSLWAIIIIKVVILFAVIRLFLMPDKLAEYDDDIKRADAVRCALTDERLSSTVENQNNNNN